VAERPGVLRTEHRHTEPSGRSCRAKENCAQYPALLQGTATSQAVSKVSLMPAFPSPTRPAGHGHQWADVNHVACTTAVVLSTKNPSCLDTDRRDPLSCRRQGHLNAFEAITHGCRQFGQVRIVRSLLYRPFAKRSHQRCLFDGELRGQQARLNDGNQGCGSSETIYFRRGWRNLLRHATILAKAGPETEERFNTAGLPQSMK
jgi:hypothetical protein